MFRRLFLSHPRAAGESYIQHQRVALSFALPLLGAGIAALAHALIPAVCETTAGDMTANCIKGWSSAEPEVSLRNCRWWHCR